MTDHTARLDHVVLWVRDPVAAATFYAEAVGLEPVRLAEFSAGAAPFPSVRVNDETIIDLMPAEMARRMTMLPGAADSSGHPVNHVCLSLPAAGFDALRSRLEERSVPLTDFSHDSFGARGPAKRSFYFRDPDGNVFEARHYD
ncbi:MULTISPECIES: VOC family protein [unclassified Streptomyces]|uniref:VOC family protein n=2 Tax=unclassified Streptomyces TaxID=2593676 RepID=A0A6G3QS72_9ACTN|nr:MULTISPECIES: VOC family protein [unclassified Streptomyces]NEA86348.1 VOC family protein [Streptomyces sp. SID14436]NEC82517.1 VOC family protein [Streptomyces sp. SID7958]